jgi:hypothetical protein
MDSPVEVARRERPSVTVVCQDVNDVRDSRSRVYMKCEYVKGGNMVPHPGCQEPMLSCSLQETSNDRHGQADRSHYQATSGVPQRIIR